MRGYPLSLAFARQIPPFVAARHLPPERGKSALKGTPLSYVANFYAIAKSRPLGEGGIAQR
ncbi:hypothetical protein MCC02041_25380 [Faecalibacterium prausnitzii]|nr:hypothetical protein MCC02041_25380 [Faecalibacterium prausnitzii]